MSGGAYDYCYQHAEDFARQLTEQGPSVNPRRAAFAELLKLTATAMHDIEWVDSGDYSEGQEFEAIDKVFSFLKKEEIAHLEEPDWYSDPMDMEKIEELNSEDIEDIIRLSDTDHFMVEGWKSTGKRWVVLLDNNELAFFESEQDALKALEEAKTP